MKLLNYIIIKLTFCLIIGIYLAYHFKISIQNSIGFGICLLVLVGISYYTSKKNYKNYIWFGLLSYSLMVAIGIITYTTHFQKNFSSHYTNNKSIRLQDTSDIYLRIKERLKPNLFQSKYVAEILKINQQQVSGKILLNISKDSIQKSYSVDDILLIESPIMNVKKSLNPYQFDYKAYLEKQYIYHQIHTRHNFIFEISSTKKTIIGFADSFRQNVNVQLKKIDFKQEELAVINALILGQRQDLSKGLYSNYVNAGAIHILAVSGLHVGIIMMILNFILRPLEQLKHGRMYKVLSIIILLWSFAIIAGLSASVTRAVTMFSILSVAMHLKRPTNIYNTLAISIFILLLFKPMFLFDIGFQLSYLAVLAIVSFQPIIAKFWLPKWSFVNYFWQIFTVTIAAQLGVFPISLFYFHQFPGLFFISNMIIIPILGVILGLGILVILLSLFDALPLLLAQMYSELITFMNTTVTWVSSHDTFLFEDISFNIYQVFTYYLFIVTSFVLLKKINYKRIAIVLVSVIGLQGSFLLIKYKTKDIEFVIFHKNRHSILAKKTQNKLKIWHNLDSNAIKNQNLIRSYKVENFIKTLSYDSLSNVYKTSNKVLLIIDSIGVYNVNFKVDFILLRNSPKVNLKRLILRLQPKLIIADGSNYKSYVERWKVTCKKEKLPFHSTYEQGAYIIK